MFKLITIDIELAYNLPPTVTVNVKNEFKDPSGTLSNGGTVNIDYENIPNTENLSGQQVTKIFNEGDVHRFEAKEQLFGSYSRGFNHYTEYNGGWILPNPSSPPQYTATINLPMQAGTYTAKYRNLYNIYTSGFAPEFNEAILNISDPFQTWQYEYGQIYAPETKTFAGKLCGFYNWWDNLSVNPRNVSPTNNTTYTAYYKAHLYSTSSTATAPNNQRKIVQGSNGYWAMVYVSMNNVWLSRSTDGVNWEREILISGGYAANNPSIAVSDNYANIVWQEINWLGNGNGFNSCEINMRSYNLSDNTLGQSIRVDNFTPDIENFQATPVIDGEWSPSYTSEMVVWREPDGLKIKRYTNSYGWSSKGIISGTNSYSINPSIVDYNSSIFFICWEDAANHKIKYIEASYGTSWSFFSAADVSPSYWTENMNPQMTLVSGNKPTIVWTSRNNIIEGLSVHVRQKSGGVWQNITSFSQTEPVSTNPVVGDYDGQNKMDVLWDIGNSIYKASYNGSSWTGPTFLTSNGGSGVNINRTTAYQTKAIFKKSDNTIAFYNVGGTAPPSKIVASSEDKETTLPYRLNRHAIIELPKDIDSTAKGSISFEIAGISTIYNETETKINYSADENNLLSSGPVKVAATGMQLSFSGAIYGSGLELPDKFVTTINEPLAKVILKDSKTNETLQNIWVNNSAMLNQVKNKTFGEFRNVSVDLNKYLGKSVYVQVEMVGKSKNITPLIVDDYLILSDSSSIANSVAKKNLAVYNLPTDYTLMQNYPNPFNPVTTISFFIPQNDYVTLKIYNTLGEEVMTAINENLEQGYHSVNINMSKETSGVYLYSISAGGFRDTKKLLLLK